MDIAVGLVGLATTVLLVTGLCKRFNLASPLVLIVVGIVVSYIPQIPDVELKPEVVLFGLLPPLLYSASLTTSLVDFKANRRVIGLLSVGLVVFTTAGVAVVAHWLVPDLPWGAAFAIGAVVAPPDAVAATSIGRRIGLPRRIVTILEGESLLNDATALVALRTAIAATVAAGTVARDFLLAAGGGLLVGLVVYWVVARVRRHVTDPLLDSGLSFVVPFGAYVGAESIHIGEAHGSGVLAVVVAGLLLGHNAPVLQTAQSRIQERMNWSSIAYLLESTVFLLIGLQAARIISDARAEGLSGGRVVLICVSVLVAVIVLRLVWMFATRLLLTGQEGGDRRRPPPKYALLLGWAGMRGVVTLAAAFVIPVGTEHRDVLLLVAFAVVAGTLFIQGLTLPWLARRLDVPSPDPGADALARANLLQQASQAGMSYLKELKQDDPYGVVAQIKERLERRNFAAWESVGARDEETPTEVYTRVRREMIDAERGYVLEARDEGHIPNEVITRVLTQLDVEESMLENSERERARVRDAVRSVAIDGGCDHLREERPPVEPTSPGECAACVEEGLAWVHLRMCLTCGTVGCCDSSIGRHASRHFHETKHPVMRSVEPGDDWRWCFVDRITG
ncbi:Na+/H+ antiporter [Nocardioides mangrovicus]|uniref:Na+/H+ antiporter n=1 Tax=Nocardioides mangrovicus TaxID=2478913 RepID=A0A3L8P7A5_9ACTN|nr:Na+/H+ antiporter [Nocardioides mangrovicus]RLV50509.1 Na+/H+ antiporter [Nocardioides mangrovicus]